MVLVHIPTRDQKLPRALEFLLAATDRTLFQRLLLDIVA